MNVQSLRKNHPKFICERARKMQKLAFVFPSERNKCRVKNPEPPRLGLKPFIYKKFLYQISGRNLKILFEFKIEPNIYFKPEVTIKNINKSRIAQIGDRVLRNLIFHLGLAEIPSYWKATCSPKIIVEAGPLNSEQIKWWKDLILNGMGQFFYENKIDFTKPDFLQITSEKTNLQKSVPCKINRGLSSVRLKNRYLVPMGGGRDSVITLELLRKQKKNINCFLVNPTKAAKRVLKIAKIKNPIEIKRIIDSNLLKLNQKGYLNGHTPFTAVLSFLSVFCAVLFDYKNIAFSNEKSADEGNVRYLGKVINHQWSKSSEFERKFKNYCKKYLTKNINYFSLVRPYTELEISKMFSKYPQYFLAFSSCNRGQKIRKQWCGECPKCLFVYATLYPFLRKETLLKIFGKDIFENKKLLQTMEALIGQGRLKPFECVGTKNESLAAFYLSWKKNRGEGIPFLLKHFEEKILPKRPVFLDP